MPNLYFIRADVSDAGFPVRQGAGKALYAHSGNKFRKCRPDLLHEVVRKPNPQPTHAYARQDSGSEQQRPTTFITPTLNSTLIQPGSQPIPPAEENQLEHENTWLKMKILVLERDLKYSEDRQLAMENRLRRAEGRLVELETQLIEPKKRPERIPTGEATLNPTVLPMTDHPVCNAEPRLSSRERIPEIQARMSGVSFGSPLAGETFYRPFDQLFNPAFSVPPQYGFQATQDPDKRWFS